MPIEDLNIIWGAQRIKKAIKAKSVRATYHLLESGSLPCAKKVGGQWCVSEAELRKFFASGNGAKLSEQTHG